MGGWEMSGTGKMEEESPAGNSLHSSLALGPKVHRRIHKLKKLHKLLKKTSLHILRTITLLGLFLYAKKRPV